MEPLILILVYAPRCVCSVPTPLQFQEITGVQYPALYEDFLSILDLVNLNIGFILSLSCVLCTDHYERLLFATLGPIFVLSCLMVLHAMAMERNSHSPAAERKVKRKFLAVATFIVFFVYSSASHTIFQTFVCETLDDDKEYLRADYSLECTTTRHKIFEAYAAVMVAIYPIGIPAFFSWWFFKNRHVLTDPSHPLLSSDEITALRDLWDPYKPHRFYYEIVEYVRRIALTGLSVFFYPGSSAQVAIVLFLAVLFTLLSEVLSPFREKRDAWLYRAGNCITYLSMYLALLLKVDVSDEDDQSQGVFSALLIMANIGLVLAIVSQSVYWVTGGLPEVRPKVGPRPTRSSSHQVTDRSPASITDPTTRSEAT